MRETPGGNCGTSIPCHILTAIRWLNTAPAPRSQMSRLGATVLVTDACLGRNQGRCVGDLRRCQGFFSICHHRAKVQRPAPQAAEYAGTLDSFECLST